MSLPAMASSVELGLSLITDAIRADLYELGYKINGIVLTHCAHLKPAGLQNVHAFPWTISAFIVVRGVEVMYQSSDTTIELSFKHLLAKLPPASEANA